EAPARKPAAGSKARPHLDEQTGLGGRSGFGLLEFLALLFEDRPAAELNFVAFQRQNLYQDLIAFVQLVAYLLYAALRDFGDVQQAVGAGEDLDECAEIDDADNLAQVSLAYFGYRANVGDHLDAAVRGSAVGGENLHAAIVFHVDLATGGFDDPADHLTARSDQLADLVGRNLQSENAGRVRRHGSARGRNRRIHLFQNVQPG